MFNIFWKIFNGDIMTWDWHWIGSFKGTPFYWGDFRYNSGDPYKSYRFGPLLIRVFLN